MCYSFLFSITFSYNAFISYGFVPSLQSIAVLPLLLLLTAFSLFKTLLIFFHTGPTAWQQGREDPSVEKCWIAQPSFIDEELRNFD